MRDEWTKVNELAWRWQARKYRCIIPKRLEAVITINVSKLKIPSPSQIIIHAVSCHYEMENVILQPGGFGTLGRAVLGFGPVAKIIDTIYMTVTS